MEALLAAAVGLALGQLLDLLFDRFYTGERLSDPLYRCFSCKSRLRPVFALPLAGFLWSRGRCPDCLAPLPLLALVLPGGGAALFVASYFVFDELGAGLLGGFFATIFLTLTLTDLERRLLPNRIVYPSIVIAAALSWAWPDTSAVQILAGGGVAVAVAAVFLLLSLPFGANAFGMGDVKMIVLIGFVVGLPLIFVGIFFGTMAAGVIAAAIWLVRRFRGPIRSRKSLLITPQEGLAFQWGEGIVRIGKDRYVSAGTGVAVDDSINYVFVDKTGTVASNTIGYPAHSVRVARLTTSQGEIVDFIDDRGHYIPHGPFLALGAVVALFWGEDLWDR